MDSWFTVEKIDNETYVISEYKHWEETHCYLLIGIDKCLLIDTGLGVGNLLEVINRLTDLPVEVVVTHVHWDHIGGLKYFKNIAVHDAEKEWLTNEFPIPIQLVIKNLIREPCDFPTYFNKDNYEIFKGQPTAILQDNDIIDLENRKIEIIHTPGHSPGHICLYEPDKKYLYSGDLIYMGKLDAFYPTTNPYEFMKSIDKIRRLAIERIFPAHYSLSINVEIIENIDKAFKDLFYSGKLAHGNGIFYFENFSIHI